MKTLLRSLVVVAIIVAGASVAVTQSTENPTNYAFTVISSTNTANSAVVANAAVSNGVTRVGSCVICNDSAIPFYWAPAWNVTTNGFLLMGSNCVTVLPGVRYQGPIAARSISNVPTHGTIIEPR